MARLNSPVVDSSTHPQSGPPTKEWLDERKANEAHFNKLVDETVKHIESGEYDRISKESRRIKEN